MLINKYKIIQVDIIAKEAIIAISIIMAFMTKEDIINIVDIHNNG